MRWVAALAFALRMPSVWAGASPPPTLRLPPVATPVRYALELWIDPAVETFRGRVEIRVSLKEASDTLWLNGKGLTIEAASVGAAASKDAERAEASAEGKDFIRLRLPKTLPAGELDLGLTYTGPIGTKEVRGVFRQKDGDDWYAFTFFEPIDARRAFPCFDEPSYKTPWQLTIHAPKGALAVSNAPLVSQAEDAGGGRRFVFAPTKPLPSYLVAFGVGPFDVVDAGFGGRGKTPIRMIVPKGRGAEAHWAVESTGAILERLETYFDVPYPYEKLDQLVVPRLGDAMEHPGLVTYGAGGILAKDADETIAFRRGYASVCAHETAHMWFGNLVTASWWDDIWLNEAFATWMASKILTRWKPEWNEEVERASGRSRAMSLDSLVTARRIRQPIVTNDDIWNAFDGITYTKGAAVIGMFEGWLGEEGFRKGVRSYLKHHAWRNATAEDFVAAIAEATRTPAVVPAFRSFLDQPGVPLVTADVACGAAAPKVLLSQKRFLPAGSKGSGAETWQVPVCVRSGDPAAATSCTLLTRGAGELPLPGACPDRVLANASSGYYRVLYKGDLLGKLVEGREHLTAAERVSVLSDAYSLARSGDLPIASALGLVPVFASDPSRSVVEVDLQIASVPVDLLVTDETRPRYRRFVSRAFGPRAAALGWRRKAGDDDETQLLRPAILAFAANEGDEPALVAEAMRLARSWLKDRSALDSLLVPSILEVAARHGDMELFQAFLAEARKATDRRERRRLLRAIGQFRDPAVVPVALALTLSPDFDARDSFFDIVRTGASDRETLPRAWAFLTANFDALADRLPEDWPAFFPFLATGFSDDARRAEVEAFFKPRISKYTGGPRNLAQALETIQIQTAFKAAQQASFDGFLNR